MKLTPSQRSAMTAFAFRLWPNNLAAALAILEQARSH